MFSWPVSKSHLGNAPRRSSVSWPVATPWAGSKLHERKERYLQMKTRHAVSVVATLLLAGAISATAADPQRLDTESTDAIQMFRAHSEKTQHLFDTAYAYAIFPSVGKGAAGIGAAEGRGLV